MAEEPNKEGETPEQPKAGGSKLVIVAIVLGVLVVLAAGTVAAAVVMNNRKAPSIDEVPADAADAESALVSPIEEELEEGEEALGAIFPLESFVVNLSNGKYLRVQMKLEFMERDIPRRFLARLAPVRDSIISLLTSKRSDDVLAADGKENLKREIKDRVNEVLRREEVKTVYFSQFVVQG